MTKTAALLTLIVAALAGMPAHARVFVSGHGLDTNPCTATQPCRTFQQAFNTAPANDEIEVLDPADYGPLTITHGITIQWHGFGGITQPAPCAACGAITISVTTLEPVMLNGLTLDGAGSGSAGIYIASGLSVQILNSVIRYFHAGIYQATSTNFSSLFVEDTVVSDNRNTGILVTGTGDGVKATLNRITANHNSFGVVIASPNRLPEAKSRATIANSVMSNNFVSGLQNDSGFAWLAKSVISGNMAGVVVNATVFSYGDNYINDNMTPVIGSLTPVPTQ
jgi:hypothetical protein